MLVTFPRYVLRELGKAFGVSLLVYTFALLAIYCALALVEGATLTTALSLILRLFPLISPLALPFSVVTAIMICYGRLSANNEFVGAQASGINPLWIAAPALLVALLCSIITVYLNDEVLTSSVAGIERSLLADRTEILRSRLTKPGSFAFPISNQEVLSISRLPSSWDSQNRNSVDFTRFKKPGSSGEPPQDWDPAYPYPETRVLARNHEITVTEDEEGTMYIGAQFSDGAEHIYSRGTLVLGDAGRRKMSFVVPKSGINFTINRDRTQYMGIDRLRLEKNRAESAFAEQIIVRFLALMREAPGFSTDYADFSAQATAARLDRDLAVKRAFLRQAISLCQKREIALPEDLQAMADSFFGGYDGRIPAAGEIARYVAEINVKLVMSFACISFAFIGIPIGLIARRGSSMIGFAISLGFAFAFYMVITALHGAVRDGSLPWWGLWLPNLAILAIGLVLWHRTVRGIN